MCTHIPGHPVPAATDENDAEIWGIFPMVHDIEIRQSDDRRRWHVYWRKTGEYIHTSREPHYTTCRVLQAKGLTGLVHFWRQDKAIWDMAIDIDAGAKLTIKESPPRVIRFDPKKDALDDA